MRWREAMQQALYGPEGFFRHQRPADHFRTSAQSPMFGAAVARLVTGVDAALRHPRHLDLVDVGAGRGELLTSVLRALPPTVLDRVRPVAVEVEPPRADTTAGAAAGPAGTPAITWRTDLPQQVTGLLLATEWLDNVPVDLARDGRYLHVDGACGEGLEAADAAWVRRWWPDGAEVEIGRPRDEAWATAVARLRAGAALAVDYGHTVADRPAWTTLTGFRAGREVPPALDGSTDVTCHVAMDAVAEAGRAVPGATPYTLITQRRALHGLGVGGARPPLDLARTDPAGYLAALGRAGEAATLTDPAGLGGHWWLLQPVRIDVPWSALETAGGA